MLVLSRKPGEAIVINDNITLTVIEIRGGKVRLGIQAPKDVVVHREEVYDLIRRKETTPPPVTDSPGAAGPQTVG